MSNIGATGCSPFICDVLSGTKDQGRPEEVRLELGLEGGIRNLGLCVTAVKLDPDDCAFRGDLLLYFCAV